LTKTLNGTSSVNLPDAPKLKWPITLGGIGGISETSDQDSRFDKIVLWAIKLV